MFYVYLLLSENSIYSYVGATIDVDRRLRQHNGEIKGGAKATTSKEGKWRRVCYVSGFPDWSAALQFEWRWKQISRKIKQKKTLEKRMAALNQLLSLEKATTKAIPFSEWSTPPIIHFEEPIFPTISAFLF